MTCTVLFDNGQFALKMRVLNYEYAECTSIEMPYKNLILSTIRALDLCN